MNNDDYNSQFDEKPRGLQNRLVNLIIKISNNRLNEKQAVYVILGLVALIFIVSFIILKISFGSSAEVELPMPPAEGF